MKAFAPLSRTLPFWPGDLFGPPGGMLDLIGITDFDIDSTSTSLAFSGKVAWLQEIVLDIPAIDGATFALLDAGGFTEVGFKVALGPEFSLKLGQLEAEFRFVSEALRPVTLNTTTQVWEPVLDGNGDPAPAVFAIGGIYLHVDGDGQVAFVNQAGAPDFPTITPPALLLGGSGIVLNLTAVKLYLSDKQAPPAGAPAGFKGIAIDTAEIILGDDFGSALPPNNVTITNLLIGSSGFSGKIEATWQYGTDSDGNYTGPGMGELLGMQFGLKSLEFNFSQNKLIGSAIKGVITLPFFDHPLDVTVGYDAKGGVTVAIDSTDGLFTLTKPGFLEVVVDSLRIEAQGKKGIVKISGKMTPLYGNLNWPTFDLRELSIDQDGHIKLDSGWIDLPKQESLSFNGFTLEITKFGLGKVDGGGRWVGFSASVNLIKGIKGNAAVDGLRIILHESGPPAITLEGVRVDMTMAGAFELKGAVKFKDDQDDQRFDGAAMLALKKPELVIDTELTIGRKYATNSTPEFKYFGMYGGIELPTGIPFGPISIFGFSGLLALNMRPDRQVGEPWYALPPGASWYHRSTPPGANPPGVRPLMDKWGPKEGATAFGAGLTLGTSDGFTFNAKAMLVLAFPGITVLVTGRGNLLKERKALSSNEEPLFGALAVLDFEAGEYTFGLDAYYKYAADGEVIEIRGSLEAYYNQHNPHDWHIWLGTQPMASRIQARIITLFQAKAYFMIDGSGVKTGAWIGYDNSWHPGPLSITLQAWLDANAALSVKPNHFHADLWLHAAVQLSAFGIGVGLLADARLAADIKDPFHIKGEMSVTLSLPWPLKSITSDITLEWGQDQGTPPIPIVLKGLGIEHPKSSATWLLEVGTAIVPSYDDGSGYLGGPGSGQPGATSVVAMDARPAIAFARPVHDDALVGVNALAPVPAFEQIGDPSTGTGPASVRFALKGVILEKHTTTGWTPVAGKGFGADGLDPLYGSWGTVPSDADPVAVDQNKLYLWAKTPFVQTRHTGDDLNDWFAANYPNYPCADDVPFRCYDVDGARTGRVVAPTGALATHIVNPVNAGIEEFSPGGWSIDALAPPIDGRTQVLHTLRAGSQKHECTITLTSPDATTGLVRLRFDAVATRTITVTVRDAQGVLTIQTFTTSSDRFESWQPSATIVSIAISSKEAIGIVETCLGAGDPSVEENQRLAENIRTATSVWSAQGNVLEPHTDYRLKIITEAKVRPLGGSDDNRPQTSYAYFTTGGPPGIGDFSVPEGQTPASIAAGPDSLATYVRQTVPATIGQGDQAPALPRPVFLAADVGAEFNADYVDLLYRLAHRGLRLQIFDSNGAPARDAIGRSLSFENPWGVTSDLVLDDASAAWLAMVDPQCVPIDQASIAHNQTIGTAGTPLLLDPTTRYRARLVPLLVQDDFAAPRRMHGAQADSPGARIGEWCVEEFEGVLPPSRWTIDNAGSTNGVFVLQDRAVAGTATAATLCPPGSALLWRPATGGSISWKSQRVALFVSGAAGGAAGVVLLHTGPQDCFVVMLHEPAGVCRLVRRTSTGASVLAEGPAAFPSGTDTELVVEACDTGIRAFVNGAAVLTYVIDLSHHQGGETGLWCWNNPAARFKDVRIEDQSGTAANAFSFEFVTSNYVNFFHLAEARRTPAWAVETAGGDKERTAPELAQLSSTAVASSTAPLPATEVRQYEDLAALWLGPGLVRDPDAPDVNRILRGGDVLGWAVRSPEPLDWKRTEITLLHCADAIPESQLLGPVKITGAMLGMTAGDDEYVDLLGLEDCDLLGWKLQLRDGSGTSNGLVDAAFDDQATTWLDLHAFAAGDSIDAGIRLRLFSGGLVQPPLSHVHRTMNCVPPGNAGVARLPAGGADLRLVDPAGRTACAVRILPPSAFAAVAQPRMLRRADATGVILLPNAGAAIPAGAYALEMRYRRDATSIDPESVVLSQAGDTTDELAFVSLY